MGYMRIFTAEELDDLVINGTEQDAIDRIGKFDLTKDEYETVIAVMVRGTRVVELAQSSSEQTKIYKLLRDVYTFITGQSEGPRNHKRKSGW